MKRKVFVIDWSYKGIIAEGEVDGKIVDKHYMRLNGDLYNVATMYKDTPENRKFVLDAIKIYNDMLNAAAVFQVEHFNEISRRNIRITAPD